MKKSPLIALLCWLITTTAFAQQFSLDELIDKGIKLHDEGKYVEALGYYRQALSIDSTSSRANTEMATTYISMERYDQAIYYADKVLAKNGDNRDLAYTLKGTAYDMMGKYDEAIGTYRKGIDEYPTYYMLDYNIALTYFKQKQYDYAEKYAINAINLKMTHASSHLILGYCKYYQEKRAECLLALYYFLLLEPNSKRAAGVLDIVHKQLEGGARVSKEGGDKINITIPHVTEADEFGAAEVTLSMMSATKYIDDGKKKKKTDMEAFTDLTGSFFKLVGELKESNKTKHSPGIWWDTYTPFFYQLAQKGYTEVYCNYISLADNDNAAVTWLKAHEAQVNKFSKWYDGYK